MPPPPRLMGGTHSKFLTTADFVVVAVAVAAAGMEVSSWIEFLMWPLGCLSLSLLYPGRA